MKLEFKLGEKVYHVTTKKYGIVTDTRVDSDICHVRHSGYLWAINHRYLKHIKPRNTSKNTATKSST